MLPYCILHKRYLGMRPLHAQVARDGSALN